jgi:carboxypeptidase Taq
MTTMEEKLQDLKTRLLEADDIQNANALLFWDQTCYMPPGGAEARGRQTATLARIAQEKFTDPAVGKLLDELEPWAETLPYDHDDAAMIRATRRDYDRQTRVPPAFTAQMYAHAADAYHAWMKARAAADFSIARPFLEKTVELSRQLADFFPGYQHIADPLIDRADYGMKATDVRRVFAELREQLTPLVQTITSQPPIDDSCVRQYFPKQGQLDFGNKVIAKLGYDFQRGRQDLAPHPYMTRFSLGDVRITTRVDENFLTDCIFSLFHEAGHAMYEQGVRLEYEGTPLAGGTSAGVHESQSRLWENLVGRSRGFWEHFYPMLQLEFPDQLGDVSLDIFHRAINKVERSLIRTDADEVTYNLHVMIRFDLELAMLEGALEVKDLPEAWDARYTSDLGVTPPNVARGVLQDMHWFYAMVGGMFQGYTLGNILSAMFYEKALAAHPEIPDEIAQGEFGKLHGWFREHIYQHGSKYTAPELIERVTGGGLDVAPLIRYLTDKYHDIYNL